MVERFRRRDLPQIVTVELQTANITYFQRKIHLSGFSAYPDGSLPKLIRISGFLLYLHVSHHFKKHRDVRKKIIYLYIINKQVTEGKIKGEIEVTRRRGRRRKKLLDDLKDRRGYYHLKEEDLDRIMWRNRFGRGVAPVVRLLNE